MEALPPIVDRQHFESLISQLRTREKAHTREGDAIAAARRRLPVVEIKPATKLLGIKGDVSLLDVFEGRSQLFVSYHMWHDGQEAADQCEGCTFNTGHALELSYLHSRDVTFVTFCQGPIDESDRYREFMGWNMPWYSVPAESYGNLGLQEAHSFGMKACYLRRGDRIFETYWTTGRGCEIMGNSYGMLDMTVYGRQEDWEDSPHGWPKNWNTKGGQFRSTEIAQPDGRSRPISQWSRLAARQNDDFTGLS